MKSILIFAMILFFAMNAFGQQAAAGDSLTREDYLKRSEKENAAAWTIFSIGTGAMAGGLLIAAGSNEDLESGLSTIFIGVPLFIAGAVLDLVSIPLFKSARKNKKRAGDPEASLGLKVTPPIRQGSTTPEDTPETPVKGKR